MNKLDPIAERVLGFFVAKKLLRAPDVRPYPNTKLYIEDVLRVAEEVSPRIIEVLPAALIRFPNTFLHKEKLPANLQEVVEAIKRGEKDHPGIKGYHYRDMKRWAEKVLPDSRSKTPSERKQMVSFRLGRETLNKIKSLAEEKGIAQTKVVEQAISQFVK